MNELALFAGAGGGILGGHLLGWRTVCAVERDAYAAQVLAQRQNDGVLPPFPIWSDVTTFDGRPWRGIVDVISGGFPCQDISIAGKGAGIEGERSGMWKHFKRIIREVNPRLVYVENSAMLTIRGLGTVLRDLASLGFNAEWGVLSCRDTGGVHLRERAWIVATNTNMLGCLHGKVKEFTTKARQQAQCDVTSSIHDSNYRSQRIQGGKQKQVFKFTRFPWGEDVRRPEDLRNRPDIPQPIIRRIGDDVASGMDRLKAIGNGQVPRVAATAFELLSSRND